MPNYGATEFGTAPTYGGAATYTPTTGELLGSLFHFCGSDGPTRHNSPIPPSTDIQRKILGGLEIAGGVGAIVAAATAEVDSVGLATPIILGGVAGGAAAIMDGMEKWTGEPPPDGSKGLATYVPDTWNKVTSVSTTVADWESTGVTLPSDYQFQIAEAVWMRSFQRLGNALGRGSSSGAQIMSMIADRMMILATYQGFPTLATMDFDIVYWSVFGPEDGYPTWDWDPPIVCPDPIAPALIHPDDTVLSYLTREQAAFNWSNLGPMQAGQMSPWVFSEQQDWGGFFRCRYTSAQLQALRNSAIPAVVPVTWPGAADVTLGTPVAIAATGIFDCEGEGALVEVVSNSPGGWVYPVGAHNRYPHIGWLAFMDADGNLDSMQQLQFDTQVYVPHTMRSVTSVAVFLKGGASVVVTPWSLAVT